MSQWTREDVDKIMARMAGRAAKASQPTSKYRNVKVEVNGEKFDSKREAAYWIGLKAREAAGEITSLRRQVPHDLLCPSEGQHVVVSHYIADFVYRDKAGRHHTVDAKGKKTAIYLLKRKWLELQDSIVIEEV